MMITTQLPRHTLTSATACCMPITEVVAVLDKTDGKTVRLCDAHTGRILADSAITHDCEVSTICYWQFQ
jgi:hypothetical protein